MFPIIHVKKIKKVLDSEVTSYRLAKELSLSRAAIEKYRNGQLDIMNMKLINALKFQSYYNKRNEELEMDKIKELQADLKRANHQESITIWNNKAEFFENLRQNNEPGVEWEEMFQDSLGNFSNEEPVIECENENGEPTYFTVNDFTDIYDYFK